MVGNRGDGVVHDDRGDDGSAGAGHADHETGGDGASHRTLNDSARRADRFHSTDYSKRKKVRIITKGGKCKGKKYGPNSAETGQAWCVTDVVEKRSPEKACEVWMTKIFNQPQGK